MSGREFWIDQIDGAAVEFLAVEAQIGDKDQYKNWIRTIEYQEYARLQVDYKLKDEMHYRCSVELVAVEAERDALRAELALVRAELDEERKTTGG